ncbi:MAG: MarR family transcriptional regulator [Bacteroidetes bacterium]|nr:MarR family transcriptional regulator [Bacteroidota bacterium]HET6244160.1 MarR family transcriptional regulator [Bacteroidia bacterium]
MKQKESICFNLKTSWYTVARMYNSNGSPFELSASIGYVLLNIDKTEGTTATQIAALIGMESTSLTRMLKTLEDKKLIIKKQDIKDKRAVKIFLTEQGMIKREISKKTVKNFNKKVREEVSKEKIDVFFEVMEIINKIAEKNYID